MFVSKSFCLSTINFDIMIDLWWVQDERRRRDLNHIKHLKIDDRDRIVHSRNSRLLRINDKKKMSFSWEMWDELKNCIIFDSIIFWESTNSQCQLCRDQSRLLRFHFWHHAHLKVANVSRSSTSFSYDSNFCWRCVLKLMTRKRSCRVSVSILKSNVFFLNASFFSTSFMTFVKIAFDDIVTSSAHIMSTLLLLSRRVHQVDDLNHEWSSNQETLRSWTRQFTCRCATIKRRWQHHRWFQLLLFYLQWWLHHLLSLLLSFLLLFQQRQKIKILKIFSTSTKKLLCLSSLLFFDREMSRL